MNKEREARYTWDEEYSPELLKEGDGPELDISALVEAARKEREAQKDTAA